MGSNLYAMLPMWTDNFGLSENAKIVDIIKL